MNAADASPPRRPRTWLKRIALGAAVALGNIGADAKDATDALSQMLKEKDAKMRTVAGDALRKINTQARDLAARPVREFMTPNPQTLVADAKIAFAVQRMDLGGFRHLPIVDQRGDLIGVISARDILRYLTERIAAGGRQ